MAIFFWIIENKEEIKDKSTKENDNFLVENCRFLLAKQNNKDAGDFLKKITSEHIASAFTKKHELFQHEKFKSQHVFIIS